MKINAESSMINWWLEGLGMLVPTRLKNLFNPLKKRILIQLQNDQLAVIWPHKGESKSQSDLYHLQIASERKDLSRLLTKHNQDNYDLVLCLPAKKGLKNTIKLPFNAESDLASILEFEIERQTPFTRDQVYSGYQLIDKNKSENILNVELNVIPKKYLDPQLSELQKVGIAPQMVELFTNETSSGINVLPELAPETKHKGTQRINHLLLLLATVLFAITIILPFRGVDQAIKQTDSAMKEAQAGATEVNELQAKWRDSQEKQNVVNKKIESHRSVTVILEELTRLLPDDTWLTRFHMNKETIRLQGESTTASNLISIIEKSDHFSGTRFQSPVTSNTATGNDRFQITTQNMIKPIPQVTAK